MHVDAAYKIPDNITKMETRRRVAMTSEELAIFKIKEIMSWDLEDIKEY
jgi:hypothetical protein